jgi:glycosyltransferase involved in cell wall biosynthesis
MHQHHCLVYPSHGEGFGLIPLQAIATGMPTILTDWSALDEFSEYGIKLDYKIGPTGPGFYYGLGEWAEPSFDDLCIKMESVYNMYGGYAEDAYNNALSVRSDERFDWNIISDRVLGLLRRR